MNTQKQIKALSSMLVIAALFGLFASISPLTISAVKAQDAPTETPLAEVTPTETPPATVKDMPTEIPTLAFSCGQSESVLTALTLDGVD